MVASRRWNWTVWTLPQRFADGEGTAFAVGAHDVADEEVALLRAFDELVHDDAEEEGVPRQFLVALAEPAEELAEHVQALLAVELQEEVADAGRDLHRLADGAAALGDDSVHGDVPVHRHSDGALAQGGLPQEEGVPARPAGAAGEAADLGAGRKGVVQPRQEPIGAEREGVGQQDELWRRVDGNACHGFPAVRGGVRVRHVGVFHAEGLEGDVRHAGGGQGESRALLDLAAAADDAAGGAPEKQRGAECLAEEGGEPVVLRAVVC